MEWRIVRLSRLPVKGLAVNPEVLQKFEDARFVVSFRGYLFLPCILQISAHPVGEIGHILFQDELSIEEVLLKLRQARIFVVCQISHILRLSLLVLITRLYEKTNTFTIVFKAFFY